MDRYYQVARCFRDEDLRADRQPEFTQARKRRPPGNNPRACPAPSLLAGAAACDRVGPARSRRASHRACAQLDIEMAFTPKERIMELAEELMVAAFKEGLGADIPRPFPRMTYADAMERYGCDKPDVRYGLELRTVSDAVAGCGFRVFADAVKGGGVVKCIAVPEGARVKNTAVKPKGDVFEQAVAAGAQGLAYARVVRGEGGALALDASKPIKEGFAAEGAEKKLARRPPMFYSLRHRHQRARPGAGRRTGLELRAI